MQALITGCQGQLGLELIRQIEKAQEKSIGVIATDLSDLDITDESSVLRICRTEKPDVIINCAAYTDVDACEEDEKRAFRVNALGPRNLAAAAFEVGADILQVSTDYVFDGRGDMPKREYDGVNPVNVYGRSKALGERLVRESNPRHFIIRTAWLYGEGRNFVRTMLNLAREKDEISVVNDQIGTPTSTKEMARCILLLVRTKSYGTYHGSCEGSCSWYEFARKVFEYRQMAVKVIPVTTEAFPRRAERPRYSVLENFMLNLKGLNTFRPWEEALRDYLQSEGSGV